MKKEKFQISGMTCSSCVAHIEKDLKNLNGVLSLNINLLTSTMVIKYDEKLLNSDKIIDNIISSGYGANLISSNNNSSKTKKIKISNNSKTLQNLIISIILSIILMYISMGEMFHFPMPFFFIEPKYSLVLALSEAIISLIIIYLNRHYYITGFKRLFKLSPNMDSLVAIGSGVSYLYGIYTIFMISIALGNGNLTEAHHQTMNLYFDSSAMILVFVSIGKYLENLSKNKTTSAISALIDLAPKKANLFKNNTEEIIDVNEIKVDDILIVRKGELIPVDSIIIDGNADIDESNITGESIPVYKQLGDKVISSSILLRGVISIKAQKIAEDSTFNQILKLVDEASSSKAPISKLVDKISLYFVPSVITIAIVCFIIYLSLGYQFEFALKIGLSVLVISCPCALGLATPLAIMISSGLGAKNGILIRDAEILEKAQKTNIIVFDKTGTLTESKPRINKEYIFSELYYDVSNSLEYLSEHPLAIPFKERIRNEKMKLTEVKNFETRDGLGISGTINGNVYFSGNIKYIESIISNINSKYNDIIEEISRSGATPILFSNEKELLGIASIKDTIRKEAFEAIELLHKEHIKTIMLTGDNKVTANAIAKELHIDEVLSDVSPIEKERYIRNLQNRKYHVAMVGDGVNDALALTSSSLSITLGSASDVAKSSSDIILLRNNLLDIGNAIRLSKLTFLNIKISLFWAFIYNIIGILFASGVFYLSYGILLTPMIGALAMSFSSLFVVGNSLLLYTYRSKRSNSCNLTYKKENINMEKEFKFNVDGMSCMHCVARVENILKEIPTVKSVKVSLENKEASVIAAEEFDPDIAAKAITEAGYKTKIK